MEAIPLYVFIMVICSAVFHASWNFLARKVKGNIPVLYISIAIATLICLPIVIYLHFYPLYNNTSSLLSLSTDWRVGALVGATGFIHAIYFITLGLSYKYGEISVVYPIARGTGVILTFVIAYLFLDEQAGVLGLLGVLMVVTGILLVSLDCKMICSKTTPTAYKKIELTVVLSSKNAVNNDDGGDDVISTQGSERDVDVQADDVIGTQSGEDKNTAKTGEKIEEEGLLVEEKKEVVGGVSDKTKKRNSIFFALVVGLSICAYSIVDKLGMTIITMDPITYMFLLTLFASTFMSPYMLYHHRGDIKVAFQNYKLYLLLVGPMMSTAYIVILFAYRVSAVSLVVALREVSVVVGCILGFVFLKERPTPQKIGGICAIVGGIAMVKFA